MSIPTNNDWIIYRQFHSTETAVTKVFNDLLLAADDGEVSALCLLDLTAAFDTVDQDLMLLKLERQFGLHGIVLKCFQSYLCDRTFRVIYNGSALFTSLAPYHKDRYSARGCLLCTPLILKRRSMSTALIMMLTLMTCSCICIVSATTRRLLLRNLTLCHGY